MKELTEKLQGGGDLNYNDIRYAVTLLLSDQTRAAEKAAFLDALHNKGETPEEIAGFVEQLIDRSIEPGIDANSVPGPLLDVCGTGGTGLDLFNISTTIMFILAAGGAVVVKHGNRAVTSCCGSADVLEALGVKLVWTPEELRSCVERLGLGFMFARYYHPAFAALAEMRAQLAQQNRRTIFSLLGPLLNPVRPQHQMIGVFAPRLTMTLAEVLRALGRRRAWVVHGSTETGAGMDDISIGGATTLAELDHGRISSALLDCRWLGIPPGPLEELRGGDAAANAAITTGILKGEIRGPKRDLVIANAAGGFVAAGIAQEMPPAIAFAKEQLDSGRAYAKLRALQELSAKTA